MKNMLQLPYSTFNGADINNYGLIDSCGGLGSGHFVKQVRAGLVRVMLMAQGTISMVLLRLYQHIILLRPSGSDTVIPPKRRAGTVSG